MKVCALIAEFNPLHNGHAYLINCIKEKGYTHLVVIMSGNFVQRGEPAIFSKEIRTKMALEMGANLVIELPTVNVLSTAQKYARSAIGLLKHIKSVQALAFGMESDTIHNLNIIKDALRNDNFSNYLKNFLSKGVTFAKARENALERILSNPELTQEIKHPNNILAIEYMNSLEGTDIDIVPFKRMEDPCCYLSATKIRNLIIAKNDIYKKYIPFRCEKVISNPINFPISEKLILFKLRSLNIHQISELPDITEGLENRIYDAIKKSCSLKELLFNIKTKRYTMSRIKRILLCALLDINSSLTDKPMKYIRVLGSDKKGFEIVKNTTIPIATRYKDILNIGKDAKDFFEIENKCTNLYNTLTENLLPCETEKTFKLIKD